MLVAVLSATTNANKPSDPDHSHLKWGMIQYEGVGTNFSVQSIVKWKLLRLHELSIRFFSLDFNELQSRVFVFLCKY